MDAKTIDWSEFSDEEIERFLIELEAERKKRGEEKRRVLKEQIESMVKEHGITLTELFPQTGREKSQRKEKRPRGERTVKYRNPWTGTGRKPAWLAEALTSGQTLEEFEV